MSGILGIGGQSGLSVYAVIRNATAGDVWNGTTFEAFTAGNWATYDVAMTEQSTTGFYKANFPSSITSGMYFITFHSGSSPTVLDTLIGQDKGVWDGTAWLTGIAFTDTQKTEINAEMLDIFNNYAMPELSGVPDATPSPFQAFMLLFMWLRNNTTATANTRSVRDSAGTAIGTATMSDDGSTFQQGKLS